MWVRPNTSEYLDMALWPPVSNFYNFNTNYVKVRWRWQNWRKKREKEKEGSVRALISSSLLGVKQYCLQSIGQEIQTSTI